MCVTAFQSSAHFVARAPSSRNKIPAQNAESAHYDFYPTTGRNGSNLPFLNIISCVVCFGFGNDRMQVKCLERKWKNKTHQDGRDGSVVVSTNPPQENTKCSVSTLCQQVMILAWFFTSFQLIISQLANLCTWKIVLGWQY